MATDDRSCSIHPYFSIHAGKQEEARGIIQEMVETTSAEDGCLYYGFSFDGDEAHCREAYADADAMLVHLGNAGELIGRLLEVADLTRLEVHGPADEIDKLRGPLADLNPHYFALEYGFRN